jgi:hypothetical protein
MAVPEDATPCEVAAEPRPVRDWAMRIDRVGIGHQSLRLAGVAVQGKRETRCARWGRTVLPPGRDRRTPLGVLAAGPCRLRKGELLRDPTYPDARGDGSVVLFVCVKSRRPPARKARKNQARMALSDFSRAVKSHRTCGSAAGLPSAPGARMPTLVGSAVRRCPLPLVP